MYVSGLTALLLLPSVLAAPLTVYTDVVTKHEWNSAPSGWTYHSTPSPSTLLTLRLGLKQNRFDELLAHLAESSDPSHERYGQHLSKEEVDNFVRPSSETLDAVTEWLKFHGVEPNVVSGTAGEWMTLTVPVHVANTLLNTTYHVYQHESSPDDRVLRTLSYALPRHLHAHIDVVAPTTYFGTLRSMKATHFLQPEITPLSSDVTPPSSCSSTITPTCLRDLYNTVGYTATETATNKIGIAGYLDEFANVADLNTFTSRFRTDATSANFTTIEINGGGNDQSDPGVEANLDVQYAIGVAFPTPLTYFSTGGSPPFTPDDNTPTNTNEPYLDFLNFVLALSDDDLPQTFSTSYGDDEQTVPSDYATSVCNSFATLGSRGASVLFSSGDDGVGGGDCATNTSPSQTLFQPNFPASCPFVTTVGATTRISPEVAASFSGGGFSRLFPQPSYQSSAVSTFLSALGTQFSGLFNASGRAYPDISAQGEGFQVVIGGRVGSVGGTSASSPTVAGVIALLNDFRIASGKSTLGFLNPLLYANPSALNDITSGSNPGCGTAGFTAGTGWDPVTGLGTPDFVKLQAVV